jgi:ApaG protein
MYQATTRNIRVNVRPQYLVNQSDPDEGKFVWAYTIVLENLSSETVTLLSRHWIITDGIGRVQEIKGDGVVGETPSLAPGQHFEYTSGCPLNTSSGMMVGTYQMTNQHGEIFDVEIPAFSLDSPDEQRRVN